MLNDNQKTNGPGKIYAQRMIVKNSKQYLTDFRSV